MYVYISLLGAEVHVMIQNIYMYMDSIVCGLLVLISQDPSKVFTAQVSQGNAMLSPTMSFECTSTGILIVTWGGNSKACNMRLLHCNRKLEKA